MEHFDSQQKTILKVVHSTILQKKGSKSKDVNHSELHLQEYLAENNLETPAEINNLSLSAGQECFS